VDTPTSSPLVDAARQPAWSFVYRDVIGKLRDQFRCIALDYPGFGLSHAVSHGSWGPGDVD
jgi:haloalkane dehalogenase